MKKIFYTALCLFVGISIGIPLIYNDDNRLSAAVDDNGREKIVDFNLCTSGNLTSGIVVTETKRLYYMSDFLASQNTIKPKLMSDINGSPLKDVTKVALANKIQGNYGIGLALKSDNSIYVWGTNQFGQLGTGTTSTAYINPTNINPGISDKITSMVATEGTYFIITENGDVYASGDNRYGQFGDGTTESSTTFKKLPIDNVKKMTATEPNTLYALKNDGTIYTWGGTIYDGLGKKTNISTPTPIYTENKTDVYTNVVDISANLSWKGNPSVAVLTHEENVAKGYIVGRQPTSGNASKLNITINDLTQVKSVSFGYKSDYSRPVDNISFVGDGKVYKNGAEHTYYRNDEKIVKTESVNTWQIVLTESGRVFYSPLDAHELIIKVPLQLTGIKKNAPQYDNIYQNNEKYNDNLKLVAESATSETLLCEVENPVGSKPITCSDFVDNNIEITALNQRVYKKYIVKNSLMSADLTVDLYKDNPQLADYSPTEKNEISISDIINLDVPDDQKGWNSYTATITDSSGNTSDYNGQTLTIGTYTLTVTDSYGNTQDYQFEVKDNPEPTLNFSLVNSNLTYGDNPTKVNNTIGTFTLSYPAGEPTSNIKTIQLDSSGDEAHFSVDTTGALKVKGTDLDAGTYSVTVSGTDGNDMAFTKTVSITVNKKNQDNYQITNQANYPFQLNQEIVITTSGNDSGENETYTITNGNSVAQIVGNKFKLLSSGTFTLEATVAGNTNYNSKTVTKQITVSQLPTQNPPVSITSNDSFMYGDTYTPSYSGGQGSGAVSWSIENDNGTGAALSNGKVTVTGVGTFTIKVTKAGTSSYQESTATKVITVNKRKTIVKPKDVTKTVGQAFKDNGATYNPQPVTGDNIGTLTITSKYPNNQVPGRYTDGIQASGLSNPNYEFEYQEGTLIINSNSLPNNGEGYYKVTGIKGKNNWYISDVQISTTNKNGYDEISNDGINFQTTPLVYSTDGDYPTDFYLRNSSTGLIAKAIRYQLKIDQTPPDVPTLSMKEINKSAIARFINALSFGNWMNQAAEVTMTSNDGTSGIDYYEYTETSKDGTNTKQSTSGIVTYQNDVELTLQAKACDKAGNCSDLSSDEGIMIDRKAPTITGVKDKSEYKFYYLPRFVKVTDDYSGLSYSEYKLDGAMAGTIQNNVDERISSVGEYEVYAIDNAGNDITITFKIVPLPDIETEIDGSDESKDIIDQIIDELDEIKDKIDETEKKDIEDWIKDALDKWNSLRKKVVETDDKSAKVEGQGDTDFDPSVILIVDDITDHADDIPPLPRKPITVYDVWLQKGNVKIQPDGSIKVYLPYTEPQEALGDAMGGAKSDAKPIVYEIDTKNKVKELKVQLEGSFVTFITDKLLRYAISNDKQEINKDDTCVVGPDGKPTTGDEVCGLPNDDGKQPEKKPDGSVEVPDGGKIEFPNGTEIETPDGAIIHPDGSVTLPDGTEYDPNGNKKPSKQCKLDGIEINIDTDNDGLPDINVDLNKDCKPDINIDLDGDRIPDLSIDSNGDGKADINIDKDDDGKPDLNILKLKSWKPDKEVTINGITYDTMAGLIPDVNIDFDGDGNPDYNIDTNGDGIPDKNLLDDNGNNSGFKNNLGGANTGDNTKWVYWWILLIITTLTMIYAQYKKRQAKQSTPKGN